MAAAGREPGKAGQRRPCWPAALPARSRLHGHDDPECTSLVCVAPRAHDPAACMQCCSRTTSQPSFVARSDVTPMASKAAISAGSIQIMCPQICSPANPVLLVSSASNPEGHPLCSCKMGGEIAYGRVHVRTLRCACCRQKICTTADTCGPVDTIWRVLKRPHGVIDDFRFYQWLISLDIDDHIILSGQLGHRLMTSHCACVEHLTSQPHGPSTNTLPSICRSPTDYKAHHWGIRCLS